MARKGHSPDQIVRLLWELEVALATGSTVASACQKVGISEQTYYRLRRSYGTIGRDELKRAAAAAGGDSLRLKIGANFQYDLLFGPCEAGDIEVNQNGLTLLLDRLSASRANGVSIEFIDGPGGGYKINNPNGPPKMEQLSARELKTMLDRDEVTLFDVRPEDERAIARIDAACSLDAAGEKYLLGLGRDTPIALYCHHGSRSQGVGQQLLREGLR